MRHRKCPACGSYVSLQDKKCPYCGYDLTGETGEPQKARINRRSCIKKMSKPQMANLFRPQRRQSTTPSPKY